ncbi:mercuric reductase [Pontiella agarivorans]|uniref:Mercuric reductase n=1 Tax=Pontiella agarivorans TaxID=3038953 RepID=A0ABU5MVM7_9BACT|nr:mercuric reductase [Pontiella agarivorans]MDZ8118222.1 mercuric reductase [Pontiella agarivorans]
MTEEWNVQPAPMDEHNRKLVDNVHPADWRNPTPDGTYNLVAIGAGTAGLISAIGTAGLGGKVALIERHLMGGDCLNVGCVPSKALIASSHLAARMRHAAEFGLTPSEVPASDFPKVMERLRRIRAGISENDSAKRYTEKGVDVFIGEGKFTGRSTIEVDGQTIRFKKAVITTGARAVDPDIPGLAEAGYLTNETVFNLTERPEHLIVIGGGPIGCELAQAFRRLGSKVTIIERDRFLPREDPEASAILADSFKRDGIEVLLESAVEKVSSDGGTKTVHIVRNGNALTVDGDRIMVGIGRAPNVDHLGLEAAGVKADPRKGIVVDDNLRTSNPNIFAAGDCCMPYKFTHAADAAAQIVIQNALFGGRKKLSAANMPWCTYTAPEIAHVGMYEHDAADQGIETDAYKFEMAENDRAQAEGDAEGFVKVVVKKGTDKILGATIVAAHAGEMISEISVAMAAGMGLGKIGGVIHPYPTQSEAIKRVAGLYNQTRLTPTIAKLMKKWLTWQRR